MFSLIAKLYSSQDMPNFSEGLFHLGNESNNFVNTTNTDLLNTDKELYFNITSSTGKYFSEALILASTNPQYDKRLFIDLPVQYMNATYKLRTCCVHKLFRISEKKIDANKIF